MINLRPAHERGITRLDWLDSRHSFSFNEYYDPRYVQFRSLRVINDDRVAPGGGFPAHGHRDMEILTWVLEGALEHKDSTGGGGVITPGDIQRMSAGAGITHSEFNHSETQPVRLLQIWLRPEVRGITPGYEQQRFEPADLDGQLRLIAAPDAADGAVLVRQDARVYAARLGSAAQVRHRLAGGRHAWIQVASGELSLNGRPMIEGDGASVSGENELRIVAERPAELLLFDLA
jgi:hypothetical protein